MCCPNVVPKCSSYVPICGTQICYYALECDTKYSVYVTKYGICVPVYDTQICYF